MEKVTGKSFERCSVALCGLIACGAVFAQEFNCVFAKDKWQPHDWVLVKSARWDHFGKWIQREDYIENETPAGAKPGELLGLPLAAQTYTSMVFKEKFKGDITISADMEFADRMAPAIVIAPELGKSENSVPEYREHIEIIIFDEGVNVWHHFFRNGKPFWKKVAYSRFTLKPETRYTLEVKLANTSKGRMMSIFVDGHEFGYMDDNLPKEFHVGITGCEGINRFYSLSAKASSK